MQRGPPRRPGCGSSVTSPASACICATRGKEQASCWRPGPRAPQAHWPTPRPEPARPLRRCPWYRRQAPDRWSMRRSIRRAGAGYPVRTPAPGSAVRPHQHARRKIQAAARQRQAGDFGWPWAALHAAHPGRRKGQGLQHRRRIRRAPGIARRCSVPHCHGRAAAGSPAQRASALAAGSRQARPARCRRGPPAASRRRRAVAADARPTACASNTVHAGYRAGRARGRSPRARRSPPHDHGHVSRTARRRPRRAPGWTGHRHMGFAGKAAPLCARRSRHPAKRAVPRPRCTRWRPWRRAPRRPRARRISAGVHISGVSGRREPIQEKCVRRENRAPTPWRAHHRIPASGVTAPFSNSSRWMPATSGGHCAAMSCPRQARAQRGLLARIAAARPARSPAAGMGFERHHMQRRGPPRVLAPGSPQRQGSSRPGRSPFRQTVKTAPSPALRQCRCLAGKRGGPAPTRRRRRGTRRHTRRCKGCRRASTAARCAEPTADKQHSETRTWTIQRAIQCAA